MPINKLVKLESYLKLNSYDIKNILFIRDFLVPDFANKLYNELINEKNFIKNNWVFNNFELNKNLNLWYNKMYDSFFDIFISNDSYIKKIIEHKFWKKLFIFKKFSIHINKYEKWDYVLEHHDDYDSTEEDITIDNWFTKKFSLVYNLTKSDIENYWWELSFTKWNWKKIPPIKPYFNSLVLFYNNEYSYHKVSEVFWEAPRFILVIHYYGK